MFGPEAKLLWALPGDGKFIFALSGLRQRQGSPPLKKEFLYLIVPRALRRALHYLRIEEHFPVHLFFKLVGHDPHQSLGSY